MSATEFAQWLVDNQDKAGTEEFKTVSQAFDAAQQENPVPILETARKSGLVKGYMDPAAGANQLIRKIMPPSLKGKYSDVSDKLMEQGMKREEQAYQGGRVLQGDEGFDWTRMMGQMAAPTSIAGMGAKVPATLVKRVLQGAVMGGGYGAIQPVFDDDFATIKGMQIGGGVTLGAIMPALLSGGKWSVDKIRSAMKDPYSKEFASLSKDIQPLIGESREKIKDALMKYETRISKPTSAQAIAQASRRAKAAGEPSEVGGWVSRLQKDVSKFPEVGDKLKTTQAKRELARENIVNAIAGTDDSLAQKEAMRAANATANYGKAYAQKISGDSELKQLFDDPFMQKASAAAADTTESLGIDPKTNLTEYLHTVKIALDKMLARDAKDPLDSMGKKAVTQAKKRLVDWLKKKNPAYDEARDIYAKESIPIDQQKVGQVVKEALINPQEKEVATSYLRAMRNAPQTIKKGTGEPRYRTMKDVYPEKTINKFKKVGEELLDEQKAQGMATGTRSPLQDILNSERIEAPRILERNIVIFNHIMKKLAKGKSAEYEKVLSDMLDDPDIMLKAINQGEENMKYRVAKDMMRKLANVGTSQAGAGEMRDIGGIQ